jgi:hypothetical protein
MSNRRDDVTFYDVLLPLTTGRIPMKLHIAIACTVLVLTTHTSAELAGGQSRSHTTRVAVADALPWSNAHAVIVRDRQVREDLVVMLRTSATPTMLDAALRSLDRRNRISPVPDGREITTLKSASTTLGRRSEARERFLSAILAAIDVASPDSLREFGQARWTTIASASR